MWRVDGFATMEEAKRFKKENGGYICWEQRTPKRKQLTEIGKEYMIAAKATGIDTKKYPFFVERKVGWF